MAKAGVETRLGQTVQGANFHGVDGWTLRYASPGGSESRSAGRVQDDGETFDALVICSHDPALAAGVVADLVASELPVRTAMLEEEVDTRGRMEGLSAALLEARETKQPVFTLRSARSTRKSYSIPTLELVAQCFKIELKC